MLFGMIGNKERQCNISAMLTFAAFMEAAVTSIELRSVRIAKIDRMNIGFLNLSAMRALNGVRMCTKNR